MNRLKGLTAKRVAQADARQDIQRQADWCQQWEARVRQAERRQEERPDWDRQLARLYSDLVANGPDRTISASDHPRTDWRQCMAQHMGRLA